MGRRSKSPHRSRDKSLKTAIKSEPKSQRDSDYECEDGRKSGKHVGKTAKKELDSTDTKLEKIRTKQKLDREQLKEQLKAAETPEEKRARRLAKKLHKEQKRKERLGWGSEHFGYTNEDNPFGDEKLTETFVWKKKLDERGESTVQKTELERRARERIEKNYSELEKLKKNRETREAVRADMELIQRENEAKQFKMWHKHEDEFHLKQARLRSKIRIKESRAKAIDLLAKYINAEEDDEETEVELTEPYNYLTGLDTRDLEDLLEDIKVYRTLEADRNADYWTDIGTVAGEELAKLNRLSQQQKMAMTSKALVDRDRDTVHPSIQRDVNKIFKGKNHNQLALLETEIRKKIHGQEEGTDVAYWEGLLGHLKVHMAKARLRERHQLTLRKKLEKLKKCQQLATAAADDDTGVVKSEVDEAIFTDNFDSNATTSLVMDEKDIITEKLPKGQAVIVVDEDREKEWSQMSAAEREYTMEEVYGKGRYSPVYQPETGLQPGVEICDQVDDIKRLTFGRQQMKKTGTTESQRVAAFEAKARENMDKDEAIFSVEAPVDAQTYLWSDKYRPRKPRYFNRVHTGFEWNKYNQTHYDLDNPPPKIVQGYRFNIFYPDLLDPSEAPTFSLIACEDADFAILKFRAGPPYEDIAFKVVSREWEINHKHGYRCQFQNGIFQLWFHFKRYRYRR